MEGRKERESLLLPTFPGFALSLYVLTTWFHKDLFTHWAQALGKETKRMRTALGLYKGFADPVIC